MLESIPKMFGSTQVADCCAGAAIQAAIEALQVCLQLHLLIIFNGSTTVQLMHMFSLASTMLTIFRGFRLGQVGSCMFS